MTVDQPPIGRPLLRLGARAATVAGSYLVTAVTVLIAIVVMRAMVSPSLLRDALSFFFIATLAAGLEPATVKAAVLGGEGGPAVPGAGMGAYLCASVIKALAASPFLAALWAFSDPKIDLTCLVWTPLVTVAGFVATDLRVLFDVRGRHALAIWLKQGSLMVGLLSLCALLLAGAPLFWAIGVSTALRLCLIAAFPLMPQAGGAAAPLWRAVRRLLGDSRWMELAGASVIAASSGSMDRILALRYLAPGTYSGYYLLYEVFSKFWLLPYLLGPIIFARRAAGQQADQFIRGAWRFTLLAGLCFVALVGGIVVWAPAVVDRVVGASFGPLIVVFAVAIVAGAFTQLRIADLQGSGATRRATILIAFGAVVSAVAFFGFIRNMGADGLFWAWLVKSVVELVATLVAGGGLVGRKRV